MESKRKKVLLTLLDQYLKEKSLQLREAEKLVKDYAEQAMSSWSIGGDRAHAEAAANLIKEALGAGKKLQEEILGASNSPVNIITSPCFISLHHTQPIDKSSEYYFVKTNVRLPNTQLITAKSPIGRAITGKRAGEVIIYEIDFRHFSGTIQKIE